MQCYSSTGDYVDVDVCMSITCQYCVKMAEQIQLIFGT